MWSSKSNGAIKYWLSSYINKPLVFVDLFCCQRTPLAHIQLAVYQNPLGLFRTAAAQPCRHQACKPESPSLNQCKELVYLWCRTRHLSLLNFMRFVLPHSISMQRSSWRAALQLSILIVLSCVNPLSNHHCDISSRSLLMMWNKTCSRTDPCGAPLVVLATVLMVH